MASLNLSTHGPSIKNSYNAVISSGKLSSSSPTYAQWALFSVQTPLLSAFQNAGAKESVLKVESTGDGELSDLIEDFNEGRIQFAFVKVTDPNTSLSKFVLIAWCGGGVPERTKGYFTSHLAAASKVLHGYHVQITARSESDLEPQTIIRKVSDASGAKYSAATSQDSALAPPSQNRPLIAAKPAFTPTTSSRANPVVAARNRRNDGDDGWGDNAPVITRSELEKVEPAYKPTKVNMAELTKQKSDSTSGISNAPALAGENVVKGGYQPVGKVDIAAIRAAAKQMKDDRPEPVKGAYEPVGKVDIAAIRAKAQRPIPSESTQDEEPPKSLAERSAAFAQAERITSLPKPTVGKKFVLPPAFSGTKPPIPASSLGLGTPAPIRNAPAVGSASRTFADQGGKTPAQLWAEKKAKQTGSVPASMAATPVSPIAAQKSGNTEWRSGYSGKSWAPVQTGQYGRGVTRHSTGASDHSYTSEQTQQQQQQQQPQQPPLSPAGDGGVSALKDRFKDTSPIGGTSLPPRPIGRDEPSSYADSTPAIPIRSVVPPIEQSVDPEPEEELEPQRRESSPVRVAIPVARGPSPPPAPPAPPTSVPVSSTRPPPVPPIVPPEPEHEPTPKREPEREPELPVAPVLAPSTSVPTAGSIRAIAQYDYDKDDDNEISLQEGEYITNIDQVDPDWWMGTNSRGESGLFPSNYVEIVQEEVPAAPVAPAALTAAAPPPTPSALAPASSKPTATAQFDYEAAEDNEISFNEGEKIMNIEFPDEDWWFGTIRGQSGLFPANYVELDK